MDNLRLILIAAGLVVLALIVIFHRPDGGRKPHAKRRGDRRIEPGLGGEAGDDSGSGGEHGSPSQSRLADLEPGFDVADGPDDRPARREPQLQTESAAAGGSAAEVVGNKIVTLYVQARHDNRISGRDLLAAAIKAGLDFGEMNIFHRRQEGADRPVFSLANLTPPGSFDPAAWNLFETPGVTLFLTLPGPVSGLDAWDAMLATGRRLAELLEADLLDDERNLLTRQRIAQIREDMREYDRKAGLLD